MKRVVASVLRVAEERQGAIVLALMLVTLIGGGAYSLALGDSLRFPDEVEFLRMARFLADNHGYTFDGITPSAWRPPGYTFVLGFLLSYDAPMALLRVFNFACLAACIWLMSKLATQRFSATSGTFAAALVVCYPVLFYVAGTLYAQTFGALLFVLGLYLLVTGKRSARRWAAAGVAWGVLWVTISSFMVTCAILAPLIALFDRNDAPPRAARARIANAVRALVPLALTSLFILGAWVARNVVDMGRPIVASTNAGRTFLQGNSENARPNAGGVDISKYEAQVVGQSEIVWDDFYRAKALEWITADVPRFAQHYALKMLNFFNFTNEFTTISVSDTLTNIGLFVTYYGLLALVVVRLALARTKPVAPLEIILLFTYVVSAPINAIVLPRLRYRLPLDFMIIVVAAVGLELLLRRWARVEPQPSETRSAR